MRMSKPIEAEYIASEGVLKLTGPLEGVRDHERVLVTVDAVPAAGRGDWPTLSPEAGRELAAAVREAFGRDDIVV